MKRSRSDTGGEDDAMASGETAASTNMDVEKMIQLEHSLMKAPVEGANIAFRLSHRYLEKEMTPSATTGASEASKHWANGEGHKCLESLDGALKRLKTVKKRLEVAIEDEKSNLASGQARADHLRSLATSSSAEGVEDSWCQTRVDRCIVNYLYRTGRFETADIVVKERGMEKLVDTQLYKRLRTMQEGLRKGSCTEALLWCSENRSRLRKIKSPLELHLRIQEFIELVRTSSLQQAIKYAQKYLSSSAESYPVEVQEAMGLLAFSPSTMCSKYKSLFSGARWNKLIALLRRDLYLIHSLPTTHTIETYMKAGLCALKTPSCGQGGHHNVKDCPVCTPCLTNLAERLPYSHKTKSELICAITGLPMDDSNSPYVLPNSNVYGEKAFRQRSDCKLECPRTKDIVALADCQKLFVV